MGSRGEQLALFGRISDGFFQGADWLMGVSGPVAVGLKVGAAMTRLVVAQAEARWEAVLDQPIGVLPSGYDVPGPDEVVDWFGLDPDPPELSVQFAAQVAAGDWRGLQTAHRVLHEVLVYERPLLVALFAEALAVSDYRAIVEGYADAKAKVALVLGDARTRRVLRDWYDLLRGAGPEAGDAEARAQLEAHWKALGEAIIDAAS